jgi:hypothetical protein
MLTGHPMGARDGRQDPARRAWPSTHALAVLVVGVILIVIGLIADPDESARTLTTAFAR